MVLHFNLRSVSLTIRPTVKPSHSPLFYQPFEKLQNLIDSDLVDRISCQQWSNRFSIETIKFKYRWLWVILHFTLCCSIFPVLNHAYCLQLQRTHKLLHLSNFFLAVFRSQQWPLWINRFLLRYYRNSVRILPGPCIIYPAYQCISFYNKFQSWQTRLAS